MIELSIRLVAAGLLVLLAGLLGIPEWNLAWKTAAAVSGYASFGYFLETRGRMNSGISGFFAIADSFAIACVLAASGGLPSAGFLVLLPCALAAAKRGSLGSAMAPLSAASILVADALIGRNSGFSVPVLVQALGVLGIGALLNPKRLVTTVTRDVLRELPAEADVDPQAHLELRESYRRARTALRDLEQRAKRDQLVVELTEAKLGEGETFHKRLATKLRELIAADSLALYTLAQFEDLMVVRSIAGDHPEELRLQSLHVDLGKAPGQMRHDLDVAVSAVRTEAERMHFSNVLLTDRGRVIGLVSLFCKHAEDLEAAREEMESIAPFAAALIREESHREARERKLKETEILYSIAGTAAGADTATNLISRVVVEAADSLQLEHLGGYIIDEDRELLTAQAGQPMRIFDHLTLETGRGLASWLEAGAPEIIVYDARTDTRFSKEEALKRRIGGFCIFPLRYSERPVGFLVAGASRAGALDAPEIASLRTIAAELSQALGRLHDQSSEASGLMTQREFNTALAKASGGCLVYLEPLRLDQLIQSFGRPAVDHAVRTYTRRLRATLPLGAAMTRRSEGDLAVYLPGEEPEFAREWAHQASGLGALIGLRTPDGAREIPLGFRAKIAPIEVLKASSRKKQVA